MKRLRMPTVLAVLCIAVAITSGQGEAATQGRVLFSFHGKSEGAGPSGTLVADIHGNLYGTTQTDGATNCYCGTVFELQVKGAKYVAKTLHSFQGGADGALPEFGVITDASGALYGTTAKGGTGCDCGTVFKLTPTASGYSESIVHTFRQGQGGFDPYAGLTIDASGVLYGTTMNGGSLGYSTAFALIPQHGGRYVETTLHEFGSANDGQHPASPLLVVGNGLFGTTQAGGTRPGCSCGTVFELTPGSSGYQERIDVAGAVQRHAGGRR
jgi:uncharacterized repeat protein (TIGR03803 family)